MQASAIFVLMNGDGADLFDYITKQSRPIVVSEALAQYIPSLHPVADKGKRPDKEVVKPSGINNADGTPIMTTDFANVVRAPLMLQKYIIGQKGSFARGNGVILKPTIEDDSVFNRVYQNWQQNKTDFDLKEIAVRQMAETQVAVIFYGEKDKETLDDFRFKYKIVSPIKGDQLFPFYDDDTDDMIAFGRQYKRGDKSMYDFYAMNKGGLCDIHKFINGVPKMMDVGEGLQAQEIIKTKYTKLPIVYWEQDQGECHDTNGIIEELETGFADFLTGMGYTADPILFAKGKAMDMPYKGAPGKFIETDDAAGDLKFVTPDNATESRALQFSLLQKYIFSLNRSVMLDLETLKGLGAVSGAALERYLIDVYMDATDRQQGSWGKGVQRMVNWMLSQWMVLDREVKGLRIDVMFSRYSLQDELERVTLAVKANGNKPVVDLETGVAIANMVDDVKKTTELIKEETNVPATGSATVMQPVI